MSSYYRISNRYGDSDLISLVMRRVLECLGDAENSGYPIVESRFMREYLDDACSQQTFYTTLRLMQERGMVDAVIGSCDGIPGNVLLVAYPGTFGTTPDGIVVEASIVLCS